MKFSAYCFEKTTKTLQNTSDTRVKVSLNIVGPPGCVGTVVIEGSLDDMKVFQTGLLYDLNAVKGVL